MTEKWRRISVRNMEKALTCYGCLLLYLEKKKKLFTFTFAVDTLPNSNLNSKFRIMFLYLSWNGGIEKTVVRRTVYVVICEEQKTCVWSLQLFQQLLEYGFVQSTQICFAPRPAHMINGYSVLVSKMFLCSFLHTVTNTFSL